MLMPVRFEDKELVGLFIDTETGDMVTVGLVCPICKTVIEQEGILRPVCKNAGCLGYYEVEQVIKQVITIIPK